MTSSAGESINTLTVEQLAAESGMSVRNIRSHQARGLLPPPEVRLRVGYYGPEHVGRLKLIRDLQADGFNLAGIKRLIEDADGTVDRLERFKDALTGAQQEPAETLTIGQLGRLFRVTPEQAQRFLGWAERLGVLVPTPDGRFDAPNPSLLALAAQAVESGLELDAVLEAFEEVERQTDAVAASFVRVFISQVWNPFEQRQMPDEGWAEIDAATERLRPLAADALQVIFQRRMQAQSEAAFREIADGLRAGERVPVR